MSQNIICFMRSKVSCGFQVYREAVYDVTLYVPSRMSASDSYVHYV